MKTLENTAEKSIISNIAEKLSAAQQELDELAVELALGKAEGAEKLEEIKNEFRLRLIELWRILKATPQNESTPDLNAKMATLELALASEKTDARHLFDAQQKKLQEALLALEEAIKEKLIHHPRVNEIVSELEKFKLKLEIIRLRFVLKKFEIKDGFRSGIKKAFREIHKVFARTERKMKKAKESFADFQDEIRETYRHIRKVVEKI